MKIVDERNERDLVQADTLEPTEVCLWNHRYCLRLLESKRKHLQTQPVTGPVSESEKCVFVDLLTGETVYPPDGATVILLEATMHINWRSS